MRRPVKNRNIAGPDQKYNSVRVEKFINSVMWDGKKSTARKVVYDAFDILQEKTKAESPLEVFETAIRNVGPAMEIRSRRVGGANYQVPREVRPDRKFLLATRWLIGAARGKKGKDMAKRLAEEIILAGKNEGNAIKKKQDVHRMAEANRAFAHFSW
jgi:small subunit ribosomal protein S7